MQRMDLDPKSDLEQCPIWEIIAEIGKSVPEEEWVKIPADSSINLDHYLYRAQKISE